MKCKQCQVESHATDGWMSFAGREFSLFINNDLVCAGNKLDFCSVECVERFATRHGARLQELEERRFREGSWFKIKGDAYLLAQVGFGKVALINALDGNRWRDPIRVCDLVLGVPAHVIDELSGGERWVALSKKEALELLGERW